MSTAYAENQLVGDRLRRRAGHGTTYCECAGAHPWLSRVVMKWRTCRPALLSAGKTQTRIGQQCNTPHANPAAGNENGHASYVRLVMSALPAASENRKLRCSHFGAD